jgi:hypothetical protein
LRFLSPIEHRWQLGRISGAFKKRYESGDLQATIDEAFSLDMDME